jgi:hypothetical protein
MLKAFTFAIVLAACGSSKPAPAPTTEPAPTTTGHEQGSDMSMTAQQCTDQGGEVVGDIGDGAIHQPDYKCPKSAQPPIGHIAAEPGKPAAIEGAVCCK